MAMEDTKQKFACGPESGTILPHLVKVNGAVNVVVFHADRSWNTLAKSAFIIESPYLNFQCVTVDNHHGMRGITPISAE